MLEQISDKATQNSSKIVNTKSRRKRRKKFGANKKNVRKDFGKKNPKLASSMSTWAENFTVAATWQLKHQIAYWKAKAKALEYENRVLHDIIRQNHFVANTESHSDDEPSDSGGAEYENEDNPDECNFEVSEQFITFLTENAKYKEDARRERERFRERNKVEEPILMQEESEETLEEKQKKLQELYGSRWQQVAALEIALQSQFLHDSDKYKPVYWPNIPFNFNFN